MDLQSVKIQKLFEQFDYDIPLNHEEGITILTGPNGYGKTTILNIIYNFFKQNFFFFKKLNFEVITFNFSENKSVSITRKQHKRVTQAIQSVNGQQTVVLQERPFIDIHFELKEGIRTLENYVFNTEVENRLVQNILKLFPSMQRISQNIILDTNTGNQIDLEDFISQIQPKTLETVNGYPKKNEQIKQLISVLSAVNVYLIKEQRLLKPVNLFNHFNNKPSFSSSVQNYANELKDLIRQKQATAFQEAQKLDNSFPNRLMQAGKNLSIDDFNEKFKTLNEKLKQLQEFGIVISNIKIPEYNGSKADVLSVYLEDSEKKADFFNELVSKINLFASIIKEKFTHKKIKISGDFGFRFFTDNEQMLDLKTLSSGEQEEIVVLYELLFKTQPNTIILIDEPEISLHVSWQKSFIEDLLLIQEKLHISFLVATHSPQIINGQWDMTTDLYKLAEGQEYIKHE